MLCRLSSLERFAELHAAHLEANKGRGSGAETRIRDHTDVLSEQEFLTNRPVRSQSRGIHEQRQLQQSAVAEGSRASLLRRLSQQRWLSHR